MVDEAVSETLRTLEMRYPRFRMNKMETDENMVKDKTTHTKKNLNKGPIVGQNLCQRNESVSVKPSNLVIIFFSGIGCTNC